MAAGWRGGAARFHFGEHAMIAVKCLDRHAFAFIAVRSS
jgi:hypothetical protein